MGREPASLLTYPTRLATANSRFLQSRLRSCSRSLHATLPGKSSYVPGSIHSGTLGKGSPCAQGCALPKSSCQVHLGPCARVPPQHASSPGWVRARSPRSQRPARRSCEFLSAITRAHCLFLQRFPCQQQDFCCPISSFELLFKEWQSLGERKAALVIIYVKLIAGICSGCSGDV